MRSEPRSRRDLLESAHPAFVNHLGNNSESRPSLPTKVLLTGTNRWPLPARLAIALAKAGCEVSAVCPVPGHPLLKTHAVHGVFPYSSLRPLDSLAFAIEQSDPQIVIPCDDLGVRHLHELHARNLAGGSTRERIASLIETSLGPPESFPIVSSRDRLIRIALEEGIRVPTTRPISEGTSDFTSAEGEVPFPWVLKADGTWGGSGVRIAHNRQQAQQYFTDLTTMPSLAAILKRMLLQQDRMKPLSWWHGSKPEVILQSHVQGRPANCAVAAWKGKVLAGIAVEVVLSEGKQGPAIIVRVVDSPQMMFAAERIADRLQLSGLFGLDFMIEDGTQDTYLIEMNPRCTPLCHLRLGQGRDMVGAMLEKLTGQAMPNQGTMPDTENDLIAYFPQAWMYPNPYLQASYQDIPKEEPELIEWLMRPRSGRSQLGRIFDSLRRIRGREVISETCLFPDAVRESRMAQAPGL